MSATNNGAARVIAFRARHGAPHAAKIELAENEQRATAASWEVLSLVLAMETLDHCLAFHDRMGRLRYATRTWMALLQGSSDAETLRAQVTEFAQAVSGMAATARLGASVQRVAARSVVGCRGEYQLRATWIGADLFGGGASILVAITLPTPDPSSAEQLRARFGLTRAQARVAQSLAQGLRNDEIARCLFLSKHTVRHHIEQIRQKVGGHTRAAVINRLRMQP